MVMFQDPFGEHTSLKCLFPEILTPATYIQISTSVVLSVQVLPVIGLS